MRLYTYQQGVYSIYIRIVLQQDLRRIYVIVSHSNVQESSLRTLHKPGPSLSQHESIIHSQYAKHHVFIVCDASALEHMQPIKSLDIALTSRLQGILYMAKGLRNGWLAQGGC